MATIQADVREIRQTVYGRDMREPIADACEHIARMENGISEADMQKAKDVWEKAKADLNDILLDGGRHLNNTTTLVTQIENKLDTRVVSITPSPNETWYTYDYLNFEIRNLSIASDKLAEVVTENIQSALISGDDYQAIITIDNASVSLISGDDYLSVIPNPVKETHPHYGEDWTMVWTRANGS